MLIEQHDEWEGGDRRYFSEESMLELATMSTPTETIEEVNLIPELTAAYAKSTAPHEDRKLHHPAGRDRRREVCLQAGSRPPHSRERLRQWAARTCGEVSSLN